MKRHVSTMLHVTCGHMKISPVFLCFFLYGVFGDTGDVRTVSVMEGDSVSLHTHLTHIQTDDLILWIFGAESARIAQINRAVNKISTYALDGRFRDRLMLDSQTGSLTIKNITSQHTGLYELQIYSGNDVRSWRFSVIVSAPLPGPVITSDCPQNSSSTSNCVLVCSVMNVSHVTLSWYKANSLFSSVSVSDLNIRLSLPLEVEYQDINTYSCVVNNSIRNQTQYLNITDVCQRCSGQWSGVSEDHDLPSGVRVRMAVVVVAMLVLIMMGIFCIYRKFRKTDQHDQIPGEELTELNGAAKMTTVADAVKNIQVKAGDPVELQTGVTDIHSCDLIQWKFGEAGESTNPCVPIVRMKRNNDEFVLYNAVDEIVGNRLTLNPQTGSLTIDNSKPTDSGLYKVEVNNSSNNHVCKSFVVTVSEE